MAKKKKEERQNHQKNYGQSSIPLALFFYYTHVETPELVAIEHFSIARMMGKGEKVVGCRQEYTIFINHRQASVFSLFHCFLGGIYLSFEFFSLQ